MSNISGLAQLTTTITSGNNLAQGIAVVTANTFVGYQPENPGASSQPNKPMLFHYEDENSITLESDITDHYVEDNTTLNDQISLRPETITVRGYIGELTDAVEDKTLQKVKTAADKLGALAAFTPEVSAAALRAYQEAFFALQIAESVARTFNQAKTGDAPAEIDGTVDSENSAMKNQGKTVSKQSLMFQKFYQYWRTRTLFTVQTPWAIFRHCAIKTVRVVQDASTNTITDFEVTFKIIRFATTHTQGPEQASDKMQGRAADNTDEENQGVQPLSKETAMPEAPAQPTEIGGLK